MSNILTAVFVVAVIAFAVGVVLAAAAVIMAVPADKKAEAIREKLPGANCGACGFSGCDGYAKALAHGQAKLGLCSPGGQGVIDEIALIIDSDRVESVRKASVVHCSGNDCNTSKKVLYQGVESCMAANRLFGGMGECPYGCIGFGDCMASCEYGAINIDNGVADIDPELCRACGKCEDVCPKHLIRIEPVKTHAVVKCSNCEKGVFTKESCKVGCIGCMKCVKECENSAITIENFHAVIDTEKCSGCKKCVEVCPRNIITIIGT